MNTTQNLTLSAADQYLLTFQHLFTWVALTSSFGGRLYPRVVRLNFNEHLGFYTFAKSTSRKIGQIEKNPFVTLSIYQGGDLNVIVAHCTARISSKKEEINLLYTDQLKKVGYSGPDDPTLRLIFFTVHSVENETKRFEGVPVDPGLANFVPKEEAPTPESVAFETEKGLSLFHEAIKDVLNAHFLTWNGNEYADRMMQTLYNQEFGGYHITWLNTRKIAEIKKNPHIALLFEDRAKGRQIIVNAKAIIRYEPEIREKGWVEHFRQYGFGGLTDKTWCILLYSVESVTVHGGGNPHPIVYVCDPTKSGFVAQAEKKADAKVDL